MNSRLTVALIVSTVVVFIAEAAVDTVLLPAPLKVSAVQVLARVGLSFKREKIGK